MPTSLSHRAQSIMLGFLVLSGVIAVALSLGFSAMSDGSVGTILGTVSFDRVLSLAALAIAAGVFWWTYRQRAIDRAFDFDDLP